MNEADALDMLRDAVWAIIVGCGPAVASAMAIGIGIALMQALTQVQEATLTFVPKIVVILVVMATTGSFTGAHLFAFTERVYGRIERGF
jgi:flagellar biosynthetic protein FliQ